MTRYRYLVLFFLFLFYIPLSQAQEVTNGLIQINTEDHKVPIIDLNGSWEFYWDRLYTPDDFRKGTVDEPIYVDVPNSWNTYVDGEGNSFPDYGYATFRAKVVFDERVEELCFYIPKIWSANKVWINGKVVNAMGVVDPDQYKNLILEKLVMLDGGKEFEIVVQVANYSLFVAGIAQTSFQIGDAQQLERRKQLGSNLYLLWIGCVFIIGFYHLILFNFRRQVFSTLYFAILCILIVIRLIVFGEHALYQYLKITDILSFVWQSKLYFISSFMIPAIGVLYMKALYPQEVNNKVVRIIVGITSVYSFFVLVVPVSVFSPLINVFNVLNFAPILYIIVIVVLAILRKRAESTLQAIGIFMMVFAGLNDFLQSINIVLTGIPEFVPVGFGILLILQTVILAKRFSRAFSDLEKLSASLEEKVIERTEEVTRQKEEIERQNENITASINYAHRIQKAMLPSDDYIKDLFPDSFVFYKPRDIVSGDFYFFDEIKTDKVHYKFVIAADCTGHGVPGALMSMIGDALLQRIIRDRKIYSPDQILSELNEGIRIVLNQDQNENRDGMDIAVCVVSCHEQMIHFAGASNPMIYVKNGELGHIKGDKLHIGGMQPRKKTKFKLHSIPIDEDIDFYLFSDGYQDQFGGPQNQKFMVRNLRNMLFKNHTLPYQEQKEELDKVLKEWIGANERQIDDILIVGIRIDSDSLDCSSPLSEGGGFKF